MGYTALYQITSIFRPKKYFLAFCGLDSGYFGNETIYRLSKQCYWQGFISILHNLCNVLPRHVAHSPSINCANMQTVFVVFVTVKNRLIVLLCCYNRGTVINDQTCAILIASVTFCTCILFPLSYIFNVNFKLHATSERVKFAMCRTAVFLVNEIPEFKFLPNNVSVCWFFTNDFSKICRYGLSNIFYS